MEIGKFSSEKLNEIVISKINNKRSEVVLSASVGEDCAAIDLEDKLCVISTDPITGATNDVGKLSVHVSVNDIASSGAEPVGILITLLAPPTSTFAEIEHVIDQISATCDELNLDIVGGHTEVTDAVNRIVVSSTVLGKCDKQKIVSSSGAKDGDSIIITKDIGLEGTSIIATDFEGKLKDNFTCDELKNAKELSNQLSVLNEGLIAAKHGASSMHDITEGGVYGGLHEVCSSSNIGAVVYQDKIPVLDITKKICEEFNLDPYRLISSGSMIITIGEEKDLLKELESVGIKATVIGKIEYGDIFTVINDKKILIDSPRPDELFKILR